MNRLETGLLLFASPLLIVGACSLYDGATGLSGVDGGQEDHVVPTYDASDGPDAAFDAPGLDSADTAPAFDPASISGLELWLRSDQGVTMDGGAVVAWQDISGKNDPARNATANSGQGPTVIDAGFGALSFTGSAELRTGSWDGGLTAPFSVFVVSGKDVIANPPTTILFDSLNPAAQTATITNNNRLLQYAGAYGAPAAGTVSKPMSVIAVFNGASSFILRSTNVVDAGFTNPGPNGFAAGLTIGNYAGGGANSFGGYIAELIAYSRSLSATEIASLNSYAAQRYGVIIQ